VSEIFGEVSEKTNMESFACLYLREMWTSRCVIGPTLPLDNNKLCGSRHNMPRPCKFTFDLLSLKVVSESRVTWGYLCAKFSLHRPLCSRLRPDVRDRQTSSDTHHRI